MKNSPDNATLVNGTSDGMGVKNQAREMQPETLHELAREYFGKDFPNRDRHGCPDPTSLFAAAQTGRLPDDTLRAHLFGCSACFTEYRTALATRHVIVPAITGQATPSFWLAWPAKVHKRLSGQPGLAWALVAVLLLAVSLLTWTRWRSTPRPLAVTPSLTPTPLSSASVPPVLTELPAPAPLRPTVASKISATLDVDLSEYVALRDAAEPQAQARPVIKLTPVATQLRLGLPEGSLAGLYTVRLLDERDQPVASTTATSRDGTQLDVTLNLQGVVLKRYQLELHHAGQPPGIYTVLVANTGAPTAHP